MIQQSQVAPRAVHRAGALLGEGPVWVASAGLLYWLDIQGRRLLAWSPGQGIGCEWSTPLRLTALMPCAGGGFIAGSDQGVVRFTTPVALQPVAQPEPDLPLNRCNDGKTDPYGNIWIGTMDDSELAATGALYRLDPGLACHRVASGLRVPNGPAFSPDGRLLYHTDSVERVVRRYPLSADGALGEPGVFARFDEAHGYPDGMTTDAEGCLWIAFWDGWCVRRFSPQAELLAEIDLPVQRPTSCTFGGEDLATLYITSARVGLPDEALRRQPLAGSLFECPVAVPGLAPTLFPG
jgi:sugar lactone lactonase YvrE